MDSYPELFNDVFGPVMQPGSSSHTAAPCRLGHLAGDLLGESAVDVRVQLDSSFGERIGVRMTRTLSLRNTSSKGLANLASRSWMRKQTGVSRPSIAQIAGLLGHPGRARMGADSCQVHRPRGTAR